MIKNIFYILTIILCAATVFFGYTTKGKLEAETATTIERFDDNKVVADNIEDKDGEIKVAKEERKTAVDGRNETSASLENESSKENGLIKQQGELEGEIEGYDADLEQIEGAIATAEAIIREMVPEAGANMGVDAVVGHIEDLENELKEKDSELEEKTEIATKLGQAVTSAASRKENLQGRLAKVKQRIALNRVTATVTGVSNEYGFAIISRGANNSNIDERSELIVSRNGSLVARLKVAQVEPTQTICDVVPSSLKKGQRIRNGDRVTIEVPASN
ncbi:MAG: hypothetical protein ACSHYB_08480 [Roseibacillus sp.]